MDEIASLKHIPDLSPQLHYHDLKDFGKDLETRRWWIAVCFYIYSSWATLSSLSHMTTSVPSMEYLGIDIFQLTILANSTFVTVLLFSYVGSWYSHKAFQDTFLISLTLTTLGAWIRYIAGPNFTWVLIGQVILGLGGAASVGIMNIIPDRWFAARERFVVTTLCVYATPFAMALGYILPLFIVKDDDPNGVPLYTLIQAIFLSIAFIIGISSITERPKIPPSFSALMKLSDPQTFWKSLKYMFAIPGAKLTVTTFGLVISVCLSVPMLSAVIVKNYSASSTDVNILGAGFAISGIISGILSTFWIAKSKGKHPDMSIKILIAPAIVALILLEFVKFPNLLGVFICYCIIGLGMIGSVPFVYYTFTEMTFPVPESVSSTTISMLSALFTIIIAFIAGTSLLEKNVYLLLAIITLPCWIYFVFFMKIEYRREKADKAHRKIDQTSYTSIAILEEKTGRGFKPILTRLNLFDTNEKKEN